jgi:hypothetical protein
MDDWIRGNTTEGQRILILIALFGMIPLFFYLLSVFFPTRCPQCKATGKGVGGWHCNNCGWRSEDTAP